MDTFHSSREKGLRLKTKVKIEENLVSIDPNNSQSKPDFYNQAFQPETHGDINTKRNIIHQTASSSTTNKCNKKSIAEDITVNIARTNDHHPATHGATKYL